MPSTAQLLAIETCVDFVRQHAEEKYDADISTVGLKVLDGELVFHPLGPQFGLFLDNKIGSKMVENRYGIPATEKTVVLGDLGTESADRQYFGLIFHEFGHATFDSLGRNSEHGAFCVELTAIVDAVVTGLVTLDAAQAYTEARIGNGMLEANVTMVKNKLWEARYDVCRNYLTNKTRAVMSYPGGQV